MPFDGTDYQGRSLSLDKMDRIIDLLSDERRWCKRHRKTADGRYCIAGAMAAVDATTRDIRNAILLTIGQVTGEHHSIENFNDAPETTHALVMSVLRAARGRLIMDSLTVPAPLPKARIGLWARLARTFAAAAQ